MGLVEDNDTSLVISLSLTKNWSFWRQLLTSLLLIEGWTRLQWKLWKLLESKFMSMHSLRCKWIERRTTSNYVADTSNPLRCHSGILIRIISASQIGNKCNVSNLHQEMNELRGILTDQGLHFQPGSHLITRGSNGSTNNSILLITFTERERIDNSDPSFSSERGETG